MNAINEVVSAPPSALLKSWKKEGILLVRGAIDPQRAGALLAMADSVLDYCSTKGHPADADKKRDPQQEVLRHLNHPAFFRERPEWFPLLMDLIASEEVLGPIREVLGDQPQFICTSLFMNPLVPHPKRDGSWHRDTQFMTKTDEEEKRALFESPVTNIQVQIPLLKSEDSQAVPGSHLRWDTPEEYHIRKAENQRFHTSNDMPGAVRFSLQPGDLFGFDPRALHRGRYFHEVPRRTLMLTYGAASTTRPPDYFTTQPWFLPPEYLAPLSPVTRAFFQPFVEAYRESWS